jgi:hypothetical protein
MISYFRGVLKGAERYSMVLTGVVLKGAGVLGDIARATHSVH